MNVKLIFTKIHRCSRVGGAVGVYKKAPLGKFSKKYM
jgi:hypothetical protein